MGALAGNYVSSPLRTNCRKYLWKVNINKKKKVYLVIALFPERTLFLFSLPFLVPIWVLTYLPHPHSVDNFKIRSGTTEFVKHGPRCWLKEPAPPEYTLPPASGQQAGPASECVYTGIWPRAQIHSLRPSLLQFNLGWFILSPCISVFITTTNINDNEEKLFKK